MICLSSTQTYISVLFYMAFCSLFLIEVMGRCPVGDFKEKIIEFNQSNEIELCMAGEYAHIHLPINWVYQTDCTWPCIDEGFHVIRDKFPQPSSLCSEEILMLCSKEEEIIKDCKSMICTGTCKNSTGGNVREFLTEVLLTLDKIVQKDSTSHEN
ncbi:uncharacterized protein LOC143831220 [Paroedura picta]|uniref:uncharacterized protein LOC143831220 n=1 Tax=Paroedura picta TaxID=143630 RepID=UPI004055A47D